MHSTWVRQCASLDSKNETISIHVDCVFHLIMLLVWNEFDFRVYRPCTRAHLKFGGTPTSVT